jgi:ribosome-associated protein
MKEFSLDGSDHIDLCDLMKLVDFAPNGAVAKHIIATGVVKVDGQVETRKRCKIRAGQVIEYKGQSAKVKS